MVKPCFLSIWTVLNAEKKLALKIVPGQKNLRTLGIPLLTERGCRPEGRLLFVTLCSSGAGVG